MENAEQILVIILSSALAVFLTLSIIALVKVIQILGHLKRVSEKAEKIADSAESIGEFFRISAGPVAIGKLLANISDAVFKRSQKAKRSDDE